MQEMQASTKKWTIYSTLYDDLDNEDMYEMLSMNKNTKMKGFNFIVYTFIEFKHFAKLILMNKIIDLNV